MMDGPSPMMRFSHRQMVHFQHKRKLIPFATLV
jgi:hypothetical protein